MMCLVINCEDSTKQTPPPRQIRRVVHARSSISETDPANERISRRNDKSNSSLSCSFVQLRSDISLKKLSRIEQLNEKQKVLLFMKAMILTLERNHDTRLLYQVRSIIQQCVALNLTQQQNVGDVQNDSLLQDSITCRLRKLIGIQRYWNATRDYLGYEV